MTSLVFSLLVISGAGALGAVAAVIVAYLPNRAQHFVRRPGTDSAVRVRSDVRDTSLATT